MTRMMLKATVVFALIFGVEVASAADWPSWRGPESTGMSREVASVVSWSPEGKNLLWKVPIGGRTTPIVMHGRLYLIAPVGQGESLQERVVCLDAATGETIWEHRFNVFHTDIVENRIGWTALAGDPVTGYVYAHLTGGEFYCFNGSGAVKWKVSLTEEFGRISGYGGRLQTPIIDQQRVIISFLSSSWGSHAKPAHRYVAFDKRTGEVLWWSAPGGKPLDTTYSTPVVAVIGGRRMLIAGNADGNLYGMKVRTGEKVWMFRLSKRGLNSSVVVDGDYAYISHSEENMDNTSMGRVVCIKATGYGDITKTGEVWRYDGCTAGYASPALANGRLYVVDNSAMLHCLDTQTGQLHWKYDLGRVGKGSPVVTADGVIYVGEQTGIFHILRDQGNQCVSLDREKFSRSDATVDEIFGSPAIVGGRVYFMTRYHTYALGVAGASHATASVPPKPVEQVEARSPKEVVLIYPAEVTLFPGEKVNFRAFQFSRDTVYMTRPYVTWSFTDLPGTIRTEGEFRAATDNVFSAGYVTAAGDGFEAKARVRISPRPPFTETFDDMDPGSVPPGWVGVAKKVGVAQRDGSKVLRKYGSKKHPSPPFMRLRAYATPPIEGGYTVQANLLGTRIKTKFLQYQADAGLINTRYRMMMMGREQKLRIESWSPIPRIRKDVTFSWEPDRWYTMKFQVKLVEGKALVRGKVWPREKEEPGDWQLSVTDPYPNTQGSAGLYAYSHGTTAKHDGTEVFYDNFQVTPNE